jgi:hypothetical protein
MRKNKIRKTLMRLLLIGVNILIIGCGVRHNVQDGTNCAEIEYYNSETGTRSTYFLKVEIENNKLTVIHWPNGGWLDDSHFTPPDISDGNTSFTDDRGREYTVKITNNGEDCF